MAGQPADRLFRLPARLPVDLCARGREAGRAHHRADPRRRRQQLYGRRDLRQGRALCRTHPPSGPHPLEAAQANRREGHGRFPGDRMGGRARRGRRRLPEGRATPRGGDDLALFLRRHHGARDARRHQPPPPRQALFGLPIDDLRQHGLARLRGRHRQADGGRSARDGAVRPDRHLGHQCGEHPDQCCHPRGPRAAAARRQDRRHRPLPEFDGRAGRPLPLRASRGPTAHWRAR